MLGDANGMMLLLMLLPMLRLLPSRALIWDKSMHLVCLLGPCSCRVTTLSAIFCLAGVRDPEQRHRLNLGMQITVISLNTSTE